MDNKVISYCALGLSVFALLVNFTSKPASKYDLTNEISDLRVQMIEKDAEQDKYIQDHAYQLFLQSFNKSAIFNGVEENFSLLETNYGSLLISLVDITKKGNGYTLKFKIGNPLLVTFGGLKGRIEWSPKIDYTKFNVDAEYTKTVSENSHSKDFSITDNILPGAWNIIEINISPANEENIEMIRIQDVNSETAYLRNL